MDRIFFALGALAAFIGVGLGAFAAHGLKSRLDPAMLATFEIGVRYHMYHALALLGAGWACARWPGAFTTASGWLFVAGILVFSGSLYALALSGVRGLGLIGDPRAIPQLIEHTNDPNLARVAGEAFSLITGVDLAEHYLNLETEPARSEPGDEELVDPDEAYSKAVDKAGFEGLLKRGGFSLEARKAGAAAAT